MAQLLAFITLGNAFNGVTIPDDEVSSLSVELGTFKLINVIWVDTMASTAVSALDAPLGMSAEELKAALREHLRKKGVLDEIKASAPLVALIAAEIS